MAFRLPPLAAVRAFEAAARHSSFTRAAAELGMTQAAVSFQVRALEQRVGATLFRRLPRRIELTEAGAQLAPVVTEAFARLESGFAALRGVAEGVLAVSAVTTFATNWLAPRIGAFQLAHPGLAVRLDGSSHLVDFASDEIDLAIRLGSGPWPGMRAHRLFAQSLAPLCSPNFLAQLGRAPRPSDLLALPLLEPGNGDWRQWFDQTGVSLAEPSAAPGLPVEFETQQMLASASAAGLGVALLEPYLFTDELAAGHLVQPFDIIVQTNRAYWLVYPEGRHDSPKIKVFRDWLVAEIGKARELGCQPKERRPEREGEGPNRPSSGRSRVR